MMTGVAHYFPKRVSSPGTAQEVLQHFFKHVCLGYDTAIKALFNVQKHSEEDGQVIPFCISVVSFEILKSS